MGGFPLGAVIQAGGSALSSFFGRPKTKSPADQIKSTVRGARAAGIHPLAALGASPGYSTVSGGVDTGSAIGAGLQTLGASMPREMQSLQKEQIKADIDARKAQAEMYRSRSRTMLDTAAKRARTAAVSSDHDKTDLDVPLRKPPVSFKKGDDARFKTPLGDMFVPVKGEKAISAAEDYQTWFGEAGEIGAGLLNMLYALGYTHGLPSKKEK